MLDRDRAWLNAAGKKLDEAAAKRRQLAQEL
jgi:hypothetical protein